MRAFPLLRLLINPDLPEGLSSLYERSATRIFIQLLMQEEWYGKPNATERFQKAIPLLKFSPVKQAPANLSIYFLCNYRPDAFKFFFELLTRWLIPGKRINVELFFAVDITVPEWGDEVYTMAEVIVRLETAQDISAIFDHLPRLEDEIRLGVSSAHHAMRILELKGLVTDEKIGMIKENLTTIMRRGVRNIDLDILSEMQFFLLNCSEAFKRHHEHQYISRLICCHYIFRKSIKNLAEQKPDKLHVLIKFTKTRIHTSKGSRSVLGILIALNLRGEYELFEERHLLRAIHSLQSDLVSIPDSFVLTCTNNTTQRLLYLEVEKKNSGALITPLEFKRLRKQLPAQIKNHVEVLLRATFMPRNEEEILRHILTLSKEIKYVRDLPEVILDIDRQTAQSLAFTVILVRILKPETLPLADLLAQSKSGMIFAIDRTKTVGMLRNKYPKEASVFTVRLDKAHFLKEDLYIDLSQARRTVFEELIHLIGPLRDFNGGMISSQSELLSNLRGLLGGVALRHPLLLERFFYSLQPAVMRSILDPKQIKTLFLLLLDALEDGIPAGEPVSLHTEHHADYLLMIIASKDLSFQPVLTHAVDSLMLPGLTLTSFSLTVQETHCLGYLYNCQESTKTSHFYATVRSALRTWRDM